MAGAPGNVIYTIYPSTAVFTASYSTNPSSQNFTFTNADCTVVDDHLTYTSGTVNVIGSTIITAYNHNYVYDTYDGAYTVTAILPTQSLYAWDGYDLKGDPTNDVYYTLTETITSQEPCYDEHGQAMTNLWINSQGELIGA